jgi:signal transduction histidine kinase
MARTVSKPTLSIKELLALPPSKDNALAILSRLLHDWRNPAGTLLGAAEILASDFRDVLDWTLSDNSAVVDVLSEGCKRNLALIEQLELFRRIFARATVTDYPRYPVALRLLIHDWRSPISVITSIVHLLPEMVDGVDRLTLGDGLKLVELIIDENQRNLAMLNLLDEFRGYLERLSNS